MRRARDTQSEKKTRYRKLRLCGELRAYRKTKNYVMDEMTMSTNRDQYPQVFKISYFRHNDILIQCRNCSVLLIVVLFFFFVLFFISNFFSIRVYATSGQPYRK